ncbi:hypothetical protein DENSPDRAFT_846345, partial [Dentipellis sp. KUC8613]
SPFPQRNFDFADDSDLKELREIQDTCILCSSIYTQIFSYIGYILEHTENKHVEK